MAAAADGSLSIRELARLGECSENYVRVLVRDTGLPARPASVKAGVMRLANGERTAPQIARILGARPQWVREIANDLGLPVPLSQEHHRARLEHLRQIASADLTVGEAAAIVGAPYMTVRGWIERLGLPFKQRRRGRPRRETTDV